MFDLCSCFKYLQARYVIKCFCALSRAQVLVFLPEQIRINSCIYVQKIIKKYIYNICVCVCVCVCV